MTPTVKQILSLIDTDIAPWHLAESWDNCGLCAGNPEWPVQKVLVGLDPGMPVLQAAQQWQADMILTHHPLFITPEKTIDFSMMPGLAIALAATRKMAIVCAHTNLDKAENGLNDYLANRLNITVTRALEADNQELSPSAALTGLGRIGTLPAPVSLNQVADRIKSQLNVKPVRVVGDPDLVIHDIAVCSGSGGSLIPAFLTSGATVYVTGDIKYHDARLIESHGKALIDVGHFASEIIAKDLLTRRLNQAVSRAGFSLEIRAFAGETDPFVSI
jgi:dinuclear metal center YbgI/SA1388 family protein